MSHGRTTGGRLQKARAKAVSQHWNRPQPKAENPYGIPGSVMKQLASENISDVDTYNRRLKELLEEKPDGC